MTGSVFIKLSNINFHANPFIDSLAVNPHYNRRAEKFNKWSARMWMFLKRKQKYLLTSWQNLQF